ncbi:hypothetical protein ANANG_G00055780 [Anguilla anguilla]|uniref:AF4/FMR2 C-terminal homology domain-containing protein n=1 Tax=Anguilla anguilla TaxID=7936 RepID=A0A9D3MR49_ANGAN|nr:hypothetical protein ANANG_G00055780 [Anguilla anguilla]
MGPVPVSPQSSGPVVRTGEPGHSSGASGSSSESESSSESDSDSESSSSDSECNGASRTATPEPEPPSTNKWQLDKWLNKVNPHNKALINTQPESHVLGGAQPEDGQAAEAQGTGKGKAGVPLAPPDAKDRALLSPVREKAKPRTGQKAPEGKSAKVKSPASAELAPAEAQHGQEAAQEGGALLQHRGAQQLAQTWQPQRHAQGEGASASGTRPNPGAGARAARPPPGRSPAPSCAALPQPPSRTRRNTGAQQDHPKSKEFIETESSSSECHSDPEELLKVPPLCPGPGGLGLLKAKDCNSNVLSVCSLASSSGASIPDPLEDPLLSPIPVVQSELLSPLRDLDEIKSLWVKIELSLLSRVPGRDPPELPPVKAEPRDAGAKHRRQSPASTPAEKPPSKSKRKHKSENCDALSGNKKLRLEKDSLLLPPCISPIHNHKATSTKDFEGGAEVRVFRDGSRAPQCIKGSGRTGSRVEGDLAARRRSSPERRRTGSCPPAVPLSDEPVRQRRSSECSSFSQEGGASVPSASNTSCSFPPSSSSSSSSSSHKHRKGDGKPAAHSKEEDAHGKPSSSCHGNGQPDPDLWSTPSSTSMDHSEPRRPKLMFNDTLHNADYYMQEAKKLKHKADALQDKFGKAVNYADGALSFIECGNAMERDPLEAKSPYTMYSETVELIRYAMRLKNFTSHSATVAEKKLAVLCYRCLSLLYLRMFKLKKDHALKYSRSLMEYFKNSAKSSQAPSPWGSNGKSAGTPSPMSLSPSPVSSASSGGGAPGSSSSSSGSVAIPQRIHHMAASHVNITNNILRSYEHWDTADKLARESQEFFQDLDSVMDPLTQQRSMTELVRYVRQGLHWLRIEAHLL